MPRWEAWSRRRGDVAAADVDDASPEHRRKGVQPYTLLLRTEQATAASHRPWCQQPVEASLSKRSATPDVPPGTLERITRTSEDVPLLHSPVFWVALAIVGAIGAGLYYWENRSAWGKLARGQPAQPSPAPEAKPGLSRLPRRALKRRSSIRFASRRNRCRRRTQGAADARRERRGGTAVADTCVRQAVSRRDLTVRRTHPSPRRDGRRPPAQHAPTHLFPR